MQKNNDSVSELQMFSRLIRATIRPRRPHHVRWLSTNERIFREKDVVLLRPVKDPERSFLSFPLKRGQSVQTHQGAIKHEDIISKSVREVVSSSKGV